MGSGLRLKTGGAGRRTPGAAAKRGAVGAGASCRPAPPAFAHVDAALRFLEPRTAGCPCAPRMGSWNFPTGWGSYLVGASRQMPAPPSFGSWQYRLSHPRGIGGARGRDQASRTSGHRSRLAGVRGSNGGQADSGPAGARASHLVIRAWQAGDRMRLPGGSGRKRVQDVFVDGKVPRADRHRVPIVTSADGRIVWVAGHALAGGFGVTECHKVRGSLEFRAVGRQ